MDLVRPRGILAHVVDEGLLQYLGAERGVLVALGAEPPDVLFDDLEVLAGQAIHVGAHPDDGGLYASRRPGGDRLADP